VSGGAPLATLRENAHDRSSDATKENMMAMMVSLQQRIQAPNSLRAPEDKFCRCALNYLIVNSGRHPKIEDWTVSPFDVDKDEKLGEGGLSVHDIWSAERPN
jgi:hypothetical protein